MAGQPPIGWRRPGGTISRIRLDTAQGATFVELFFDLVFVFAVTQLTSTLLHDLTWATAGRVGLLFWLVWWAWTQFTWTLNLADTEHVLVRLPTLAATAVAFFLAQSIPDAFTTAGAWFAVSYVVVRLIGLGVQTWVIAGDQRVALTRWTVLSQVGIVLVLVGGLVDPDVRLWFWLGAFVADLVAAGLAGRGEWVIEPGHFAERHGLIVIIALGESLIAAGVASREIDRDASFTITVAAAVTATCALWWTYFGSLQRRLEHRLEGRSGMEVGRFARDVYSFWHALVVGGVIGIAVGFEEAIAHPHDPLEGGAALALTIGSAAFLGGIGAAALRAGASGWGPRLALAALVLAATPLVPLAPAFVALWVLAGGVIAVDLWDGRRTT